MTNGALIQLTASSSSNPYSVVRTPAVVIRPHVTQSMGETPDFHSGKIKQRWVCNRTSSTCEPIKVYESTGTTKEKINAGYIQKEVCELHCSSKSGNGNNKKIK